MEKTEELVSQGMSGILKAWHLQLAQWGGQFLDDYNQTVYDDIVPTITTKIITSCHYFIYEDEEILRSEQEQGQEG